MTEYAWPANIAKHNTGWITSLVDWPDLVVVKPTPQESILSTTKALNDEIIRRLKDDEWIPAPSDTKPEQIKIPANSNVNAMLDAYVQHEQHQQFQNLSEIERANREKRAAYLAEFRTSLEPVERRGERADQAAIEFAAIGIKSNYLLNGGALVALPAIMQFAEKGAVNWNLLFWSVWLFVLGMATAAATNFFAYRSVMLAGEAHGHEQTARANSVKLDYYPPEDPSKMQGEVASARSKHEDLLASARKTANFGVVVHGLSIAFFMAGVSLIILGVKTV